MSKIEEYKQLWRLLPVDVASNLKFASLVANGEPCNTQYFFGEYSKPIVKWIVIVLYSPHDVEQVLYRFTGDYYEFVSGPIDHCHRPQWYQLKSYRGANGLKLKNWLQANGCQYFAKKKIKTDKTSRTEGELIEFVDYEALIKLDSSNADLTDIQQEHRLRLAKAWNDLSEKDKDVIRLLVIEKLYWADAYEELNTYIKPRDGREAMRSWSDKRKQDALSLMKGRAVKHLVKRFNQVKL